MKKARIQYFSLADTMRREDKLEWLANTRIQDIAFDTIHPDKNNNWINLAKESDWETLLPVANKDLKSDKKVIFELFSNGVATNRDEWVYDFNEKVLAQKVNFLINVYNSDVDKHKGKSQTDIQQAIDYSIKWTRAVKADLEKGKKYAFEESKIIESLYRPFVRKKLYFSKELNEMQYQNTSIWGDAGKFQNLVININTNGEEIRYLSSNIVSDLHFLGDSQCLPLYRYDKDGTRHENLTNWGLAQFQTHYADAQISKEAIFHYVYAVLHCPAYREKYELNLKRDFPRIPFYPNFWKWAQWGETLMNLHIGYENAPVYPFKRVDNNVGSQTRTVGLRADTAKPKLKAEKEEGKIVIDEETSLLNIPQEAWEYKLGNRSALEWVLDQYKEGKPKDATIAEKFNTYRFTDYKEEVIDLLGKVCHVSLQTMRIVREM